MKQIILDGKEYSLREFTEIDSGNPHWFLSYIRTLIDDPSAMIKLKDKPSLEEEEQWLDAVEAAVHDSREVMILAERKGSLVGIADMRQHPGRSDHIAEIAISIVGEQNRGIGLGSALMTELIDVGLTVIKPGPTILRLSVFDKNERAKALYRKLGFAGVARIPGQFEFQGVLQDEIILLRDC